MGFLYDGINAADLMCYIRVEKKHKFSDTQRIMGRVIVGKTKKSSLRKIKIAENDESRVG